MREEKPPCPDCGNWRDGQHCGNPVHEGKYQSDIRVTEVSGTWPRDSKGRYIPRDNS